MNFEAPSQEPAKKQVEPMSEDEMNRVIASSFDYPSMPKEEKEREERAYRATAATLYEAETGKSFTEGEAEDKKNKTEVE